MSGLRLFCLPYAGGSAVRVFHGWAERIGQAIEVCPVELPGRGTRIRDGLHTSPETLLDDVVRQVLPHTLEGGYALFGHSLGALLAFELARYMCDRQGNPPRHLVVSGYASTGGTGVPDTDHLLPEAELRARLGDLAGTPPEVLADEDLMTLVLPVVRADFTVANTYRYRPSGPLPDVPVTVLGGTDDPEAPPDTLDGWRERTTGRCAVHLFDGDHFFLDRHRDGVLAVLADALTGASPTTPITTGRTT